MDIIEQFKRQLEGIQISPEIEEVGEVVEIKDGVAKISGLRGVENFEIIQFDGSGVQGLVLNLEEYEVGAIILGSDKEIKEGKRRTFTEEEVKKKYGFK